MNPAPIHAWPKDWTKTGKQNHQCEFPLSVTHRQTHKQTQGWSIERIVSKAFHKTVQHIHQPNSIKYALFLSSCHLTWSLVAYKPRNFSCTAARAMGWHAPCLAQCSLLKLDIHVVAQMPNSCCSPLKCGIEWSNMFHGSSQFISVCEWFCHIKQFKNQNCTLIIRIAMSVSHEMNSYYNTQSICQIKWDWKAKKLRKALRSNGTEPCFQQKKPADTFFACSFFIRQILITSYIKIVSRLWWTSQNAGFLWPLRLSCVLSERGMKASWHWHHLFRTEEAAELVLGLALNVQTLGLALPFQTLGLTLDGQLQLGEPLHVQMLLLEPQLGKPLHVQMLHLALHVQLQSWQHGQLQSWQDAQDVQLQSWQHGQTLLGSPHYQILCVQMSDSWLPGQTRWFLGFAPAIGALWPAPGPGNASAAPVPGLGPWYPMAGLDPARLGNPIWLKILIFLRCCSCSWCSCMAFSYLWMLSSYDEDLSQYLILRVL